MKGIGDHRGCEFNKIIIATDTGGCSFIKDESLSY